MQTQIETPPSLGIGCECIFLSSGLSIKPCFSEKEINLAMAEMRKTLKAIAGTEVFEEDINRYIEEALDSVKTEKAPN